jgi:hypothetical protein
LNPRPLGYETGGARQAARAAGLADSGKVAGLERLLAHDDGLKAHQAVMAVFIQTDREPKAGDIACRAMSTLTGR